MTTIHDPTNAEIADALEEVSELLRAQEANAFRVRAYREAARTVREHPGRISSIAHREEGEKALMELPAIGRTLAAVIEELVHSGRIPVLDRLRGQVSPEDLFQVVPGIGEVLAGRIHEILDVDTLEELELAAHDGRLERVPGFDLRRVRAVRESLDSMLRRSTRRRARLIEQRELDLPEPPGVKTILAVDERYRREAETGTLRKIAPRRFNPEGKTWLPVLHDEVDGWTVTAMFSNTARAHELGRTDDWVVIYLERDGHEQQCTVVTEWRGELQGKRVVRGRESECLEFHRSASSSSPNVT